MQNIPACLKCLGHSRLYMRDQDDQAADGGDSGAPHAWVGVTQVLSQDIDHQETDIRLLG